MEFFTKNHPCALAGAFVLVSIILQVISMASDSWVVGLIGSLIFILAIVLGIASIILRHRARRKAIGFCQQCGDPYMSEAEKEAHGLTHRYGG